MSYDPILMSMSLKYAKDVLSKYGELQNNGSYLLCNRVYTITKNSIISEPYKNL